MNPRPKAYESSALPLSYSGKPSPDRLNSRDSAVKRIHARQARVAWALAHGELLHLLHRVSAIAGFKTAVPQLNFDLRLEVVGGWPPGVKVAGQKEGSAIWRNQLQFGATKCNLLQWEF